MNDSKNFQMTNKKEEEGLGDPNYAGWMEKPKV